MALSLANLAGVPASNVSTAVGFFAETGGQPLTNITRSVERSSSQGSKAQTGGFDSVSHLQGSRDFIDFQGVGGSVTDTEPKAEYYEEIDLDDPSASTSATPTPGATSQRPSASATRAYTWRTGSSASASASATSPPAAAENLTRFGPDLPTTTTSSGFGIEQPAALLQRETPQPQREPKVGNLRGTRVLSPQERAFRRMETRSERVPGAAEYVSEPSTEVAIREQPPQPQSFYGKGVQQFLQPTSVAFHNLPSGFSGLSPAISAAAFMAYSKVKRDGSSGESVSGKASSGKASSGKASSGNVVGIDPINSIKEAIATLIDLGKGPLRNYLIDYEVNPENKNEFFIRIQKPIGRKIQI